MKKILIFLTGLTALLFIATSLAQSLPTSTHNGQDLFLSAGENKTIQSPHQGADDDYFVHSGDGLFSNYLIHQGEGVFGIMVAHQGDGMNRVRHGKKDYLIFLKYKVLQNSFTQHGDGFNPHQGEDLFTLSDQKLS